VSIKAVVFDFGNVISHQQDPEAMGLLAAMADVTEDQARDIAFTGRGEWDAGRVEGLAHYRTGFARHGVAADEGLLHAFMRADLESWANVNEETVKLIGDIKAAGYRTGILSNMPHEFLATARKRWPVITGVDVGVYSCEHLLAKPERAIYDLLVSKLSLPADEIVFFDDVQANVDAAAAVGIKALLWTGVDAARAKLGELGILL
jgi:putative hydrolase of the HAD superfamily